LLPLRKSFTEIGNNANSKHRILQDATASVGLLSIPAIVAKSRIMQALGDIDCDVFIEMDR
jgi:hypothetical protein